MHSKVIADTKYAGIVAYLLCLLYANYSVGKVPIAFDLIAYNLIACKFIACQTHFL